jgi:hypothetical protein
MITRKQRRARGSVGVMGEFGCRLWDARRYYGY